MRKRWDRAGRIWESLRPLKARMDARGAVEPFSPPNKCWLVERYLLLYTQYNLKIYLKKTICEFIRCGTRLASTAKSAIACWTRCWPATGQTAMSTASFATPRNSALKATDSVAVPPSWWATLFRKIPFLGNLTSFSLYVFIWNRNGIESAFKSIDTKSIKAPEGQGCPRCGGSVFAAEQMLSKGQVCSISINWLNSSIEFVRYLNRNGTNCASTAPTATDRWIRSWPATAPTRIFIARPATANGGDRKVSVTDTPQLWSVLLANRKRPVKPSRVWKPRRVKAVLVADSPSTPPSRWFARTE